MSTLNSPISPLFAVSPILQNIADPLIFEALARVRPAYANFAKAMKEATLQNPWFTRENTIKMISRLGEMLDNGELAHWLAAYPLPERAPKRIGLILAGNIPLIGFHDLFCVHVAGHHAVAKNSGQDAVLLSALIDLMNAEIEGLNWKVSWRGGQIGEVDAVIATGSNNTSRYFEYYFGKYPHIIRRNRSSVAILSGKETNAELDALGDDIFDYFGLGCRNVSKLFIHTDFDLERFFKALYRHHDIVNHHKYANNYDYYRALWMMNLEKIRDNGFLILRESEAHESPVGTVFYETYSEESDLRKKLENEKDRLQCIVSINDTPFGESQKPKLRDYADGIDTMAFLTAL